MKAARYYGFLDDPSEPLYISIGDSDPPEAVFRVPFRALRSWFPHVKSVQDGNYVDWVDSMNEVVRVDEVPEPLLLVGCLAEVYADGQLVDARDLAIPSGQRSEALITTVPEASLMTIRAGWSTATCKFSTSV